MNEHPNAELVRRRSPDVLADGVRWHFPGRSTMAGDFEGRDAVVAHLANHDAVANSDVLAVLADDRFAIAIEHVTAERDGKRYNRHDVVVYRIKEGAVAEGWHYPESQYEWDDLLS
jgi:ketosteroid isomerase-like protein